MKAKRIRLIILLVSIGLFVISLTQKCYCTTNGCGDSLAVFATGIIGIFYGGAALTWLANPVLLASWISFKIGPKVSFVTSALALAISLSFLLFGSIVDDEGGHYREIVGYSAGYVLWVMSSAVMFFGNLFLRYLKKNEKQSV